MRQERWISKVIEAAEAGDLDACEAAVRDHWSVENIFRLLKTAAERYGMTSEEMAEQLEDYLERYQARQTRH